MAHACPLCDAQPLQTLRTQDAAAETCPRCHGIWLERGALDLFPDRPATLHFRAAALHAPNRCRTGGHPMARALARCARCGSPPALCPSCSTRLATVPTPACAVDTCPGCEGVWLDAGELEALVKFRPSEARPPEKASPPGALRGWEVAAPTDISEGADPWHAPGQTEPFSERGGQGGRPFVCRHCGQQLEVAATWAFDGDAYCGACRPEGAISGRELPRDMSPATQGLAPYHLHFGWWGDILGSLLDFWVSARRL